MFTHHGGEKENKAKASVQKAAMENLENSEPETVAAHEGGRLLALQSGLGNRYVQRLLNHHSGPKMVVQRKPLSKAAVGHSQEIFFRQAEASKTAATPINAGLPDQLKAGIEAVSGLSMDDVKVHYNSPKPAELQAHAYTQGADIYTASGQEKYLSHEAWHVVQQKQGRVKPTRRLKSNVNLNDDVKLEEEADVMGRKALQNVGRTERRVMKGAAPIGMNQLYPIQRQPVLPKLIKQIEDINKFLSAVAEHDSEVSVADQLRIHNFVKTLRIAQNREEYNRYLELKLQVQYEVGGIMHKELFESEKKPKQGMKRQRPTEDLDDVFSDQDSEDSEGDMDIGSHYKKSPELFQQAVDHSDYNQVKDVINPRNTNMLTFLDRTIIPSSINNNPNVSATPKSKSKLAQKLKKQKGRNLRAQQERVFFGSHLSQGSPGKFGGSLETLKSRVRSGELVAKDVKPLLLKSRKSFTIRETEEHAEQSLLHSKTWDSLKKRLIKRIQALIPGNDLEAIKDSGEAILFTLVLNRSSCRGCGLALSLALVEFWQQLADALGEKLDWQGMKKKYGSMVRFLIRFPTIYEYNKEKGADFANLEEVLRSITSAGWEVAPILPDIKGGMESFEQLNASLKKIAAVPKKSDLDFYQSGGTSSKKKMPKKETETGSNRKKREAEPASESAKGQKLSKKDEIEKADQDFDRLVLTNNCLPEALLNRRLDIVEARRLRLSLIEHGQRIGGYLDADQPVIAVIAEQFNINTNIIIYEGDQIRRRFLVVGGNVLDVTLDDRTRISERNSIVLKRIDRNHFVRK